MKTRRNKLNLRKIIYIVFSVLFAVYLSSIIFNFFEQASVKVLSSEYLAKYLPEKKVNTEYEYVQCELEDGYHILERSICERIQEKIFEEVEIEASFDQNVGSKQEVFYEEDDGYEWGVTYKKDDLISVSKFGADDHMSTVDELNQAMNSYRERKGLSTLNHDQQICDIAQTRAQQNYELGELDRHTGFEPLFNEQEIFIEMGEVLFGGSQPVSGVHIVEWGWDQSLTGHKEAISNPKWSDGCAGIAGYFAVFIFGRR